MGRSLRLPVLMQSEAFFRAQPRIDIGEDSHEAN